MKTMCSKSNPHAKGFEIVTFKGENNLLHANEIFFEAKGMVKVCSFWYSFIYACEQLDPRSIGGNW